MLFNSYEFIFVFFPLVALMFFAIGSRHARLAAAWLGLASLCFYGWWSVKALPLLLGSICFNYWAGIRLSRQAQASPGGAPRALMAFAVGMNLFVLAIFKYADFFIDNVNVALAASGHPALQKLGVALPIGISFYTFTQIAFLVDCWQGKVRESRFVHYLLFVTYFPHLIAGPVLHHGQMMPQFANPNTYRADYRKMALGLATFCAGLGKKLLIADPLGQYADVIFTAAGHPGVVNTLGGWLGVMAYAFQIYFDFSGYSDMAIGLSLFFGVQLPINFNSPYKATSIIDFWRRWHISLSTFLRDYLYVPLGGNRHGEARRYFNLSATMVLGGLWHGASWNFVLWGTMHGAYLIVNHLWRGHTSLDALLGERAARVVGWTITFVCVLLAWVLFRSPNLDVAGEIYRAMLGFNGSSGSPFKDLTLPFRQSQFYQLFIAAFFICVALPNTQTLARWVPRPFEGLRLARFGHWVGACAMGVLFMYSISRLGQNSAFLYFQF
ncbi:MAG TPA: MBOAT family protein [Burkholderiaceae bacterium]|nr:MBOAT family protein [Burkholderiaceae bacterium]